MLYVLLVATPPALLGLMLLMDRVEQPLRREALGEQLAEFLDSARPDEVETYVQRGFAPALDSYWRRRQPTGAAGHATRSTRTAG
jgi:hypothetical protein